MRVPVLARMCRMNWPLSVLGKKSWPSQGTEREDREAAQQEARNEQRAAAHQQGQDVAIGVPRPLEAALETALEQNQRIARVRGAPCGFARSRYIAMVGTSVRDRK